MYKAPATPPVAIFHAPSTPPLPSIPHVVAAKGVPIAQYAWDWAGATPKAKTQTLDADAANDADDTKDILLQNPTDTAASRAKKVSHAINKMEDIIFFRQTRPSFPSLNLLQREEGLTDRIAEMHHPSPSSPSLKLRLRKLASLHASSSAPADDSSPSASSPSAPVPPPSTPDARATKQYLWNFEAAPRPRKHRGEDKAHGDIFFRQKTQLLQHAQSLLAPYGIHVARGANFFQKSSSQPASLQPEF